MWLIAVDLFLLLGLTLRLTRLVTVDAVGRWYLQEPANRWAGYDPQYEPIGGRQRLVSGLDCQYCVGFWIAALTVADMAWMGGPGHAEQWWRYVAGTFTLNYVVAHLVGWWDVE
jgi:hypothetical protein